jgi:chaperone required for assembly of F1-ATPase
MKRFYQKVSYAAFDEGGYQILLDGRVLKTPLRFDLAIPTELIAKKIVTEWNSQKDTIVPDTMPFYSIMATAIDKAGERDLINQDIERYIQGDLLFYRAPEPQALVARQNALWNPILAFAENYFQCTLKTTTDISAVEQDNVYFRSFQAYINTLDFIEFTLLHGLVSLTGSPIISLALLEDEIGCDKAFKAVMCEEDYNSEICGESDANKSPDEIEKMNRLQRDIRSYYKFKNAL